MDIGRFTSWYPTRWEEIMAKLLDHSMPMAPDQYDADTFVRILRDLEMALTKIDFPAVVSGEDDDNGKSWFMD
jgi:hypothetical protein